MSWKGFKKAVNRLPYMIQQKAGYSDETVDDDYNAIIGQYQEFVELSKKLLDYSIKYKAALAGMFTHQESTAKTFELVYEPMGASRDGTAEELNKIKNFRDGSKAICENLLPELEMMIERKVIQPTQDLLLVLRKIDKTITKRDHRKVDFDRHRTALTKLRATNSDERSIIKSEHEFQNAQRDYEEINNLLKHELSVVIECRTEFINPILESLVSFQENLFSKIHDKYKRPFSHLSGDLGNIVGSFNSSREKVLIQLQSLSILNISASRESLCSKESLNSADGNNSVEDLPGYQEASNSGSTNKIPASKSREGLVSQSTIGSVGASVGAAAIGPYVGSASLGAQIGSVAAKAVSQNLYVALYDFEAQQNGDLGLTKGDIVIVTEKTSDSNGWWKGMKKGQNVEGLFPGKPFY
jgi:amphiphysin